MPASISADEKRLRSYFLKLVSEAELDQIEEAYLSTSEHAQLIEDAENRLVSDFVQGRLSDEEERAFTTTYLVTAARREQVAIARALGDLAQSEQPETHPSIWQRILYWVAPRPGLTLAATAAAGVFAITSIVMFLGWRGQIQSTVALKHAQELRDAQAKGEERVLSSRVLSVPVLKVDEASLAAGQTQKLTFRLPADLPDAIEIPVDLPQLAEGAVVDAALSASGQTVWVERPVKLLASGRAQYAELRIPFATIHPHLGRPFILEIIERNHASIAVFQISFETSGAAR
jgi:hypothetical protein